MRLEQDVVVFDREQDWLVDHFSCRPNGDAIEERLDIVGMQPDAAMRGRSIDRRRCVGPVNAHTAERETEPVLAERVVGPWRDDTRQRRPLPPRFLEDRLRHVPTGVLLACRDREGPERRPPVVFADGNRKCRRRATRFTEEQHPLRDVDDNRPASSSIGNDVTVVDEKLLTWFQRFRRRQAVICRKRPCVDTESRGDALPRVVIRYFVLTHATGDAAGGVAFGICTGEREYDEYHCSGDPGIPPIGHDGYASTAAAAAASSA
jgi:hypothetical protein